MPDLSPYAITLGGTDYPSKYANLLGFLDTFLSPVAGLNKIINGKMDVAQRGTSFPAIASGSYSLDRWVFGNISAGVVTISQQADAPASNEFQNSLRVAVTTADTSIAAGEFATISQMIEGFNVRDLIGRTFTISFWVRSSKTGTHCLRIGNFAADRSYVAEYAVSAANTWEYKTVTVSGGLITAGTWNWTNGLGLAVNWLLACGTTFQTTAGAWQTGNFLATSNQVNCLDTVGNIFAITGVDLKLGSVATAFEHRPVGLEEFLCNRYCLDTQSVPSGVATASGGLVGYHFPVPMRASPSFSYVSGGSLVDGVSSYAVTGATLNTASRNGARIDFTASGSAAGRGCIITGARVRFESEL